MNQAYKELQPHLERAMAFKTALVLFEWDNETLAPEQALSHTAKVAGAISAAYQEMITGSQLTTLLAECEKAKGLTETEAAVIREVREEVDDLSGIPPAEYREYKELISESGRIWAKAKADRDFQAFAPTLKKIIEWEKKFAAYRAKDGQKLYDVMLDHYEKGFYMEQLDQFFDQLKTELVPFLKQITDCGTTIRDEFLTGDYPAEKQKKLALMAAEYLGFDFAKGVLAESAHPFTTALHNHDIRFTTHYSDNVSSALFSVIHETGHAIYELGIDDKLTLSFVGQGASMGMHESQSRFFENIIGRNEAFWVPLYDRVKELFPEQLGNISREEFVAAVNKVQPGMIRTEADELTYSLHVLVRYELEKMLIEEDLEVERLPEIWADKYEEYLGIRPEHDGEGVLQDIHWAQGSFGYFPSYALGSAFGAQIYAHLKKIMDVEELLKKGELARIREYLREHIHQYGKLRDSRRLIKDMTGEEFNPDYYVQYLKEKFSKLYQL